jgi:hypothetical protein
MIISWNANAQNGLSVNEFFFFPFQTLALLAVNFCSIQIFEKSQTVKKSKQKKILQKKKKKPLKFCKLPKIFNFPVPF